ncbi:PTS sugar transporter subunit IIA [Ferdinandcohnia sp. Marseille-Q9671]
MWKFIIATHGDLAKELVNTVQMITGLGKDFNYLSMKEDTSDEEIRNSLEKSITNLKEGDSILILTDIFGGSITNICTNYLTNGNVHIVSGVNLPMLLELVNMQKDIPIDEMIASLVNQSKESIIHINKLLRKEV